MDYRKVIRMHYDYVMPSYKRQPIVVDRGRNTRLWDSKGDEYLDFFSGYVVSGLGHCPKRVVEALRRQLDRLIHIPNSFYHEGQGLLAKQIIKHAFPGKVFFCNSGAESIEGGLKLARLHGGATRTEVITMEQSFHGRTFGALSATGQAKLKQGFGPLVPGVQSVRFNDLQAVKNALTPHTCAILLELIQGEGGVNIADVEYVRELRALCDAKKMLLMFDEVQTGMGRTGRMFAFQHYDVVPDVMLLAKSLAGGISIGAVVARPELADLFGPGTHASTFGGNPIACAAGIATFETLEKDKLVENAFLMGKHLMRSLEKLKQKHALIKEIRGMGLLVGMQLDVKAQPIYENALANGLIVNATQETILRLAPPLTVQAKEIDQAINILDVIFMNQKTSSVKAG